MNLEFNLRETKVRVVVQENTALHVHTQLKNKGKNEGIVPVDEVRSTMREDRHRH